MNILGVKIDDMNQKQALETVQGWLSKPGKHWIATPNPEMIVKAGSDSEFKKNLNDADLSIPDGVGLRLAGVKNRVAGVDLMMDLVKLSAEKGFVVGFLGGRGGVAERTRDRLLKKYPNLKVGFVSEDVDMKYEVRSKKYENENHTPYSIIHNSKVDILFVAFGHGKQEKWITENLDQVPVKVAMGVGGAFDYIAGKVPRAPFWVRKIGLEWLFRLLVQPWRIKRQLALIKFIWLISRR